MGFELERVNCTLSNYADDNDLLATGTDIQLIIEILLSDLMVTINNWFCENFMILDHGKSHFMSIGKDTHDKDVFYYDNLTLNKNEEEILGANIDRKLISHQHLQKMYSKAGQKLSALLRLSPYLDTNKRKKNIHYLCQILVKLLSYSVDFLPRMSNNLINIIQEGALRITYNDQLTTFKTVLLNHNEITIHQRNLKQIIIINHITFPIMSSLSEIPENTPNTRNFQALSNEGRKMVNSDLETIQFVIFNQVI